MRKKSNTEKIELPELSSESSVCADEKVKIFGFPLTPSFSELINAAAKKAGMTRANFVRSAIANAIRSVSQDCFSADPNVCRRRGQQTAPKDDILARAAGARAVRKSKTPGMPEHARRMELLRLGCDEETIGAYIYAKSRAEKAAGRSLTAAEDEEFIKSAIARAAEIRQCNGGWGEGPPNI